MKKSTLIFLITANIFLIGAFLYWFSTRSFPWIGHDYRLFMPYLIDSYLHQKLNGLGIQWYSPSFAGGRPVFSNLQDFQYSLPQFLLWIVEPWQAVWGSIAVHLTLGFLGTFYFFKRILSLQPLTAILGGVFVLANGFYFQHLAVGHMTFHPFPLFVFLLIFFMHPKIPPYLAGALNGLFFTLLIYTGIHNVFFFALTSLICFPLLYLLKPEVWNGKRILQVALWSLPFCLLFSASKLHAVYSFMRFFPRQAQDIYSTDMFSGVIGIIHQLFGTMVIAPVYRLFSLSTVNYIEFIMAETGSPYRIWELDSGLSPALWLLLAFGATSFLWKKPGLRRQTDLKRMAAIASLCLAGWLAVEFTLAKGLLYPLLRDLPIINSMRANVRFASAFIFPLAITASVVFNYLTRDWKPGKQLGAFLGLDLLAIFSLWFFHYIPPVYQVLECDYRPIQDTYRSIHEEGKTFPIEVVADVHPWEVFQLQASSLTDPYNTMIRSYTDYQEALHEGSVFDVTDGKFNLIDPTGYVFPEENQSVVFDRIPVEDQTLLEDFIQRRQPDWEIPMLQKVLNWVSLVSILITIASIISYMGWRTIPAMRRQRNIHQIDDCKQEKA